MIKTVHTGLNAIALALAAFLVLSGPGRARAEEYAVVNTPPPMPEAMRQAGDAGTVYNAVPVGEQLATRVNGRKVPIREALRLGDGFAVPGSDGGYLWVPSPSKPVPLADADARELKLKIRELAAQLITDMDPSLRGFVALPTSFVSQEDFSRTSPLGNFIAEQLFYEFNQRGFPVREYRMAPALTVREDGEFLLSRKDKSISTKTGGVVFVVGTYFVDRQAVFVNARLVRGNGMVLRTAQVILNRAGMPRRMLAGGAKALKMGTIPIRDYKTETQPTNITPFDQGEDVH